MKFFSPFSFLNPVTAFLAKTPAKLWFSAISLALAFTGNANAAQISAAQIAQFKAMPKAQQQALAQSMGVDLNAIAGTATSVAPPVEAPSLNELVTPRETSIQNIETVNEVKEQATSVSNNQFESNEQPLELKPFGYDLFAGEPSTFAPVSDVPVPAEYKLGPGDILAVELYGKETQSLSLVINRQGNIDIPQLGPISLTGLNFSQAKNKIEQTIAQRKIGVKTSVTMGELRSMRIFVLGEAYKPASYTVSALSTVTQALYAAGGVSNVGSLRNIQVKRQGKLITTFDLYDLLLKGDTSNDIQLMSGDVVFIPTIKNRIGVTGAVARPALYEPKALNSTSIAELINLAGGLLPTAYQENIQVNRINSNGLRTVESFTYQQAQAAKGKNGDVIKVASVLSTLEKSISLKGHVARPGQYGWQQGMTLSQVLKNIHDFKEQPDLAYILIMRKHPVTGKLSALNVNFTHYIGGENPDAENIGGANPDAESTGSENTATNSNPVLKAQDSIYVFNKKQSRAESLNEVLEQLRIQTEIGEAPKTMTVLGAVRNAGTFPLGSNETVKSALRAAMGTTLTAELSFALLARKNQQLETSTIYIDLTNEASLTTALQPLDRLFVFDKNESRELLLSELNQELIQQATKSQSQFVVSINGDVKFPGQYPFVDNMTSEQLIKLAGGYNESSYLIEAEITRFEHDGIENARISHQKIDIQQSDFKLQPLDTLLIKRMPEWRDTRTITLTGEVVFPGTYVLEKGETLRDVINRAGGLTSEADPKGAIFTREQLKQKEQQEISRISEELEQQASKMSLTAENTSTKVDADEAVKLADNLKTTTAVGRLVINLPEQMTNNSELNIRLDDGDALFVPKQQQTVSVIGEVQFTAAHLYDGSNDIDDYIALAGGTKARADVARIYVIKSDGSVNMRATGWFGLGSADLEPGDTIVVPLDLEFKDNLTLWQVATQIMYNTAVSIAAIGAI